MVFGLAVVLLATVAHRRWIWVTIEGFTSRGLVGGCISGFAATVAIFATTVSFFGTGVLRACSRRRVIVGAAGATGGVELAITTPAQR